MVARLVVDALWRSRWFYVAVTVFLLAFWLMFAVGRSNPIPISMAAVSLISAVVLGPMFVLATMGLRELRHLPVSSRDLWRATWIIATLVSTGLLLCTKATVVLLVAASDFDPQVSAEAILLSAIYDFAWAGSALLVLPLLGYIVNAASHRGTLASSLAIAGMIGSLVACFGLPILLGDMLPTGVNQFTPVTTVGVMACLTLAFAALVWTPQRGVMAGERFRPPRAVVRPGIATRPRVTDQLTGVSRLIIPHMLATCALLVSTGLALASYGVISGSGVWWFVPQTPDVFDSANTGYSGLTFFVLLTGTVVIMQGLWTPWARLLKVLPLSVRQVNALLLVTPFVTWTILWIFGLLAYSLAYGPPRRLGVEFAFGMAAICALAHAALLRLQGKPYGYWVFGCLAGLLPALMRVGLRDGITPQIVFAVVGALALCTAALINHRTLTRSSSSSAVYRKPQPPFGLSAGPTR